MISARRRWCAGALLVGAGWLATPHPVPVYDGIGAPDEPYRYVAPPNGAPATAEATEAAATTPVRGGVSTNGMSVTTAEVGPQFSLFLPPRALASPDGKIAIAATPVGPTDQPQGARIDGNVYRVRLTNPAGPVTLTAKAAIATLYMRASTAKQPSPVMQYRKDAGGPWASLETRRGGQDVYVAAFPGAGDFALAFTADEGGLPVLPLLLLGGGLLVIVVVVVVRLRAAPE